MTGVQFESDVEIEPEIKIVPGKVSEISKGQTMSVSELEELSSYLGRIKSTK